MYFSTIFCPEEQRLEEECLKTLIDELRWRISYYEITPFVCITVFESRGEYHRLKGYFMHDGTFTDSTIRARGY